MEQIENYEDDFFNNNIVQINRLIARTLFFGNIVGPLLAVGTYTKLFNISLRYCFFVFLISFVFTGIQFLTTKYSKKQKYIMYQGLTFVSIFIGVVGINSNIGVYIMYGLVPFISCMYLYRKATVYACIIGYLSLVASQWGRACYISKYVENVAPMAKFLPRVAGFTIEFFFVVLFTASIASLFKKTIARAQEKNRKITQMQNSLIQSFSNIIEWSDQFTGDHIKRTSKYVELIAKRLVQMGIYTQELTPEKIELFVTAAPLHDIGKINVPNHLLSKAGRFNADEYEIMKTHSKTGFDIITHDLKDLGEPEYIQVASEMALYHHERWDGTGYPNGISGTDIPLCARIMAAADVLDALLSKRQYKEAYDIEESLSFFESSKGTHFEPCIADAVISLKEEIIPVNNRIY